jgi:hypothetical protein
MDDVTKLPAIEASLGVTLEDDKLGAVATVDVEAKLAVTLAHHEARPPRPDV